MDSVFNMLEQDPAAGSTHLSLARGLAVLEAVIAAGGSARLAEITRTTSLARSTSHYLLQALVAFGYLRQDGKTRAYHLGARAHRLTGRVLSQSELIDAAMPFLDALRQRTGESVALGLLNGHEVTLVATLDSNGPVRVVQNVGARRPVHGTALGKVLVADMPDDVAESLLDRIAFDKLTSKTVGSRTAMRRELCRARRDGYAVDDEEFAVGVRCAAAPIRDSSGRAIAAVTVVGPRQRLTKARWQQCRTEVVAAAAALSTTLGYDAAGNRA